MKMKNIIKITSILIPTLLIIFTISLGKRNIHNIAKIVKQEITEPPIVLKKRMPSLFDNIYMYLKSIFASGTQITPINKIKNLNILSHSNGEFFCLYNEIFAEKLYYFDTNDKTPFIVDCGSNIGISVLFFKTLYPNSEILAFEPSPNNFDLLSKNVKNNNLKNVSLHQKALADKPGSIKLYGEGTPLGSIIKDNPHNAKTYSVVEAIILSDYINKKVNLLKIDTEGAEFLILNELDSKNKLHFIDKIIMEYHHFTTQNNLSKLLNILEKNEFAYQICSDQHPPIENRLAQHFFIYAYKKS